jgi:TonB family protein
MVTLSCFTCELPRPSRWNTFLAGLIVNAVGVLVLTGISSHFNSVISHETVANNYRVTLIAPITYPVTRPEPRPDIPVSTRVAKLEVPKIIPPSTEKINPPQPKIEAKKPEPTKIEAATPEVAGFAPAAALSKPSPQIKTDIFDSPKSETVTVNHPAREVQTGGFGNPNGARGQGDPKQNTVTVASVGVFDLPSGPGKGNGSAGSHGVTGTIRAVGFGNVVSASQPQSRNSGNSVVASGFGDVVAQTGGSSPLQVQKKPDVEPVEIVYKPTPAYTAEARRQRVEGEVVLEVVFTASGSLQINRVVKSLGYGLDGTAQAAAQHIRFHPARRNGQPYDCAAFVHMVFELAE